MGTEAILWTIGVASVVLAVIVLSAFRIKSGLASVASKVSSNWKGWTVGIVSTIVVVFLFCRWYISSADEHKLSDDTKQWVRTGWLPDYMSGPKEIDVFRRTKGSGVIDAPDSNAVVMRVGLGNDDRINPKRVRFGSCLTKFHYRYRWSDTGLWENQMRECQAMEVVDALTSALEVETWMEMTDGTASTSTVKYYKYRVSPY